ncbi:FKBP-type peptidyl-prolyl cis-trans isomerase [Mucilaginibacter mali]|uniref:Peptidyl-prolyl cis-trans isomerase n=1 Tax=Mucilaginibacter mali TaxID=2740462 RepID=A0A7D4Q4N3_9SPHI|nr:FKBP-type peptidyl-prolyl cis-trans isomerase [Mucilaginibacter mali]QKJ31127.1 FKBP-type peptidyl-prolyl cis-trans isomerase [Mucilaginibacter mali]
MIRVLITCLCVLAIAGCKKSDDAIKKVQAQAKIDDQLIVDYISKNNLQATKVMIGNADTTGVWFINTQTGNEAALITNSSLLTVGYEGRVMGSSKVFTQTTNFHPSYRLGDMIKGWQYGLTKSQVKKGGKVRLLIASRYAYGPYDQLSLGLQANSILDFDIELFDVTN